MKSLVRDKLVELQRALLHLSYDSPIRPPEDCNTSENETYKGSEHSPRNNPENTHNGLRCSHEECKSKPKIPFTQKRAYCDPTLRVQSPLKPISYNVPNTNRGRIHAQGPRYTRRRLTIGRDIGQVYRSGPII